MSSDEAQIVLIAAGWSAAAGAVGLAVGYLLRRRSLRWLPPLVALAAVAAVVAGMLGTARAMFLSDHDFHVVLWVSVVAGVVAVAFGMALGTSLVRSSRALQTEARRFGEVGTFVVAPGGPAEFGELAEELRRTSDRLAEARDREVRLEDSRRELVSWVSHDLRTPLAGLRAMTEALEDGLAEDPVRYHHQMRAEVDRMVRMVDDLFELSRIHAGVLPITLQSVSVGDLVSEALAGAEPVARERGVRLRGTVEDGLVVRADPAGLTRVVGNLVANAIRHTPADGSVQIVGRAATGGVELSVTDGCGGIAEGDLARVFDVAWRGEQARTPEAPTSSVRGPGPAGAGLGLAIVKGIVEAHQGRVSVDNGGTGCRFQVLLPV